jgi:hypothetical protein
VSLWNVHHVTPERLQYLHKTRQRVRRRRQHCEWMQCLVLQVIQTHTHTHKQKQKDLSALYIYIYIYIYNKCGPYIYICIILFHYTGDLNNNVLWELRFSVLLCSCIITEECSSQLLCSWSLKSQFFFLMNSPAVVSISASSLMF